MLTTSVCSAILLPKSDDFLRAWGSLGGSTNVVNALVGVVACCGVAAVVGVGMTRLTLVGVEGAVSVLSAKCKVFELKPA